MNIKLSRLASHKLELLLEYLEIEWGHNSKQQFLNKLESRFSALKQNPFGFPESEWKPKLRKLVVTRQTTALYTVLDDCIYIITILDTRQNPGEIQKELTKHFG